MRKLALAEFVALDVGAHRLAVEAVRFHRSLGAVDLVVDAGGFALELAVDAFADRAVVQRDQFEARDRAAV